MDWSPAPDLLVAHARQVAAEAERRLAVTKTPDAPFFQSIDPDAHPHLRTLEPGVLKLLLTDSISPLPLHKTLILLDCLNEMRDDRFYQHERLALAKALVFSSSNLRFGPEVGLGELKEDSPVVAPWLAGVECMAQDLRHVAAPSATRAHVSHADARHIATVLEPCSVDVVITSPPYPNEKDYTRTTRLESVLGAVKQ